MTGTIHIDADERYQRGFDRKRCRVVARRDLETVARTPAFWALFAGLAVVTAGSTWTSNANGFVPVVLDLLTLVEVLVPLVAFAVGYRALLADRRRGERSVLSTYPVSRSTYVVGIFVGRAIPLLAGIAIALAPAGLLVSLNAGEWTVLATHRGLDSALLYVRFVGLAGVYGLAMLAVALAVSAVADGTRSAVALVALTWLAIGLGVDLVLSAAVDAGLVGTRVLPTLLAVSPGSAFRGLVLATTVDVASIETLAAAAPVACLGALLAWPVAALALARHRIWSP
jgi:ABC-type transport system involved in multi-copper enzyme maturation permease subunit